jgi:methylated-DNA-[protein]-cysteine S-methyltransferase
MTLARTAGIVFAATISAPPAPLSLLVQDDVLVAAGFTPDAETLRARLGPSRRRFKMRLMFELGRFTKAVEAYLAGDIQALDELAVNQEGTPYQQRVWQTLRTVPAGSTITYAELAARAGSPGTARAAGTACGRNLVAPFVPCHRVVRSGGGLGGYEYGLHVKRWLIAHER